MSFYNGQGLLKISLDTKTDLAGASVSNIVYKKPDGTVGTFAGTVSGSLIEYQVEDGDIDQAGEWQLQAYIEINSLGAWGDVVTMNFLNPLNP